MSACLDCGGHGGHFSHCPRPAVARPDQGADTDLTADDLGRRLDEGQSVEIVGPDQGADDGERCHCAYDTSGHSRDPGNGWCPATPAAQVADLRAGVVDGVERAQLMEAVAERLRSLGPVVRTTEEFAAAALRTPALAAHFAQAAADRAAVQRVEALTRLAGTNGTVRATSLRHAITGEPDNLDALRVTT